MVTTGLAVGAFVGTGVAVGKTIMPRHPLTMTATKIKHKIPNLILTKTNSKRSDDNNFVDAGNVGLLHSEKNESSGEWI